MKVSLSTDGATIDVHDLGPLLGLAPTDVRAKMRAGEITSQSEAGAGDDAGRVRLTFWYGGKRVRLTCDSSGYVLSIARAPTSRM